MLVPEGWTAEFIDGGGSGSWSVWTNPVSESQTVTVESGVSMGSWFELDGVSGSIDPTLLVAPWWGLPADSTDLIATPSPTQGPTLQACQ